MKRVLIALVFLPALAACATGWNDRPKQIDEMLGAKPSYMEETAQPMEASRAIRTADCAQPLPAEGANLSCK
jgi:hypothetical protein